MCHTAVVNTRRSESVGEGGERNCSKKNVPPPPFRSLVDPPLSLSDGFVLSLLSRCGGRTDGGGPLSQRIMPIVTHLRAQLRVNFGKRVPPRATIRPPSALSLSLARQNPFVFPSLASRKIPRFRAYSALARGARNNPACNSTSATVGFFLGGREGGGSHLVHRFNAGKCTLSSLYNLSGVTKLMNYGWPLHSPDVRI